MTDAEAGQGDDGHRCLPGARAGRRRAGAQRGDGVDGDRRGCAVRRARDRPARARHERVLLRFDRRGTLGVDQARRPAVRRGGRPMRRVPSWSPASPSSATTTGSTTAPSCSTRTGCGRCTARHICGTPSSCSSPRVPTPAPVVETAFGRIGVLVCYDMEFPEMTRSVALRGADLLVVPTNWPWADRPAGMPAGEVVIAMAAAMANRMPIACCDRRGVERGQRWHEATTIIGARRLAARDRRRRWRRHGRGRPRGCSRQATLVPQRRARGSTARHLQPG